MANVSQLFTVKDASHNPLSSVQIFVNGSPVGVTDVNGDLVVSIPSGSFTYSAKKSGYVNYSGSGTAPQASLVIPMTLSSTTSTTTLFLTVYPEEKARGVPLVVTYGSTTIDTAYDVGGIEVTGVTIGPVTISGEATGFQPFSFGFDLSQSNQCVITMTVSSDSGGALYPKAKGLQDPDVTAILPPFAPEVVPEYVAPNTGQGTYFTMTQARMYIGDVFIDELNSLQFALQDNKIPIYGYASRYWDILAQGKSIVQGQFTINFVSEGYLISTLNNYATKMNQNIPIDKEKKEQQAKLLYLVNQLQNPDSNWTPDQFTRAKNEVAALAASLGPSSVNAAAAQMRVDRQQQNNTIFGLPGNDYDNAIYSDVSFNIVVQYAGAGRTITRRLEDCTLISNESVMDHSGTPILDAYGFISRRLR